MIYHLKGGDGFMGAIAEKNSHEILYQGLKFGVNISNGQISPEPPCTLKTPSTPNSIGRDIPPTVQTQI